jgi:hypothetical protein
MWADHFKHMSDQQFMAFVNLLAIEMLAVARKRRIDCLSPQLHEIISNTGVANGATPYWWSTTAVGVRSDARPLNQQKPDGRT